MTDTQSPAPRSDPGSAPTRIAERRRTTGNRVVAFDDDPTGSQSVHGVSVVTELDPDLYARALAEPASTAFILTNSRSLDEADAVALDTGVARDVFDLAERNGWQLDAVSRSDSCLRGHVIAEVGVLNDVRTEVTGSGYDGVLFVPSYFEAGRYTEGDVHYAVVDGKPVPVGESEFAKDATFGFTSSDLKEFLAEKSAGEIDASRVLSLSLETIRSGGVAAVTEVLDRCHDLQWVIVNATGYDDLEVVVEGLQASTKSFTYRSGPSFVRALSGIAEYGTIAPQEIWADAADSGGHGLAVVGSHVGQTARQVERARERGGVVEVELSVPALVQGDAAVEIARATAEVTAALTDNDVMFYTSRDLVTGSDAADSLAIARTVSSAVVEVVRGSLAARPAWVIGKGGITSHDVLVRGLGVQRATVLGQLFPGMVSVLRPEQATEDVLGTPYVVFAGNVGDEHALADAIELFRRGQRQH